MDAQSAQIVKEIENKREQLSGNLAELETRMRDAADWRTYYHRNPWWLIGAAAFTGVVLASILIPSRNGDSRRSRY